MEIQYTSALYINEMHTIKPYEPLLYYMCTTHPELKDLTALNLVCNYHKMRHVSYYQNGAYVDPI